MKKCVYCGEEEGTVEIMNPNYDKLDTWLVCETCNEVIKLQKRMVFNVIIGNKKRVSKIRDKLLDISKKSGKPIMCAELRKDGEKYDVSIIKFKGD